MSVTSWIEFINSCSTDRREELDKTVPEYIKSKLKQEQKKAYKIQYLHQSYKLWVHKINKYDLNIKQNNLRIILCIEKYNQFGKFTAPFRFWNTKIIDTKWKICYNERKYFYKKYTKIFMRQIIHKYNNQIFDFIIVEYIGIGTKRWLLSTDLKKMQYIWIEQQLKSLFTAKQIISIKDVYGLQQIKKKCAWSNCTKKNNKKHKFKICSNCQKMAYCSRKHQKFHWLQHKHVCSIMKNKSV